MIGELEQGAFGAVRRLLEGMEHNLIMAAVVDGSSPGRIWADDPAAPTLALMSTPEGHFVTGAATDPELAGALKRLILNEVIPRARQAGWEALYLHYPEDGWKGALSEILAACSPQWDHQQYFVLKEPKVDWRAELPTGYEMRRVDRRLLGRDDLRNVERIRDWASWNFGSVEGFEARGFGFCLVHGGDIVSWCMADCVSGSRCEIGIHTDEGYRRRGFATRTVAAAVEHCLATGLTDIGWHCWSANLASAATARAAGFEKVLDHHAAIVRLTG